VAEEAALTAGAHGQSVTKLTGLLSGTTVDASPRDARWSIVLARLETALWKIIPRPFEAYGKGDPCAAGTEGTCMRRRPELEERLHELGRCGRRLRTAL
jgi:hypothetical protein